VAAAVAKRSSPPAAVLAARAAASSAPVAEPRVRRPLQAAMRQRLRVHRPDNRRWMQHAADRSLTEGSTAVTTLVRPRAARAAHGNMQPCGVHGTVPARARARGTEQLRARQLPGGDTPVLPRSALPPGTRSAGARGHELLRPRRYRPPPAFMNVHVLPACAVSITAASCGGAAARVAEAGACGQPWHAFGAAG
jgi:hypothetical protein